MAVSISPPIVIALAFGGALTLVIVGTVSAILILRRRNRRALLSMNATSVRRLSGYPGGNVAMTEADFASLPRTREMLRASTRMPQRALPPYAVINSSECLPNRQALSKPPGALTSNPTVPDIEPHQQSWPLPRRLTRSSNTMVPLAKLRGARNASAAERQGSLPRSKTEPRSTYQIAIPTGTPLSGSSPSAGLTPEPLTIKKRRSTSFSAFPTSSKAVVQEAGFYVVDSVEAQSRDVQPPRFPRSSSLCSSQPGLAPTEPVPPLPPNVISNNIQSLRNPTERRGSTNSLLSGNTSVLNDGFSKCLSQADTEFTSISLNDLTPNNSGAQEGGDFAIASAGVARSVSPNDALKQARLRPQLQTQQSFRASIQQHLPRSGSSGLSISLLNLEASRNTSTTTLTKDGSPLRKIHASGVPDRNASENLAASPSLLLHRNAVFEIQEKPKLKRSSTALQDISSNILFATCHVQEDNGSPMHDGVKSRPLSIATSDPFQYEQNTYLPSDRTSSSKAGGKGHKRQNCVRISNIPVIAPSPGGLQSTVEEVEEPTKKPHVSSPTRIPPKSNPRPPSRVILDPRSTTPTPAPRASRLSLQPSASLLNLHNPSPRSSSPSPLSTPTRQPSLLHSSASHPNRRKPIFDTPLNVAYTFKTPDRLHQLPSTPELETPSDFKFDIDFGSVLESCQNPSQPTEKGEPRPSSTLFPFPSPPRPSGVGGPRALPPSAWRRGSPTRGRVAKVNTSSSWAPHVRGSATSPRGELKRMVAALRRESSNASRLLDFERSENLRKGHERYCSLGGTEEREEESGDEVDKENDFFYGAEGKRGRKVEKREKSETCKAFESVLRGPREMPLEPRKTVGGLRLKAEAGLIEGESEEGFYDDNGFLKS